MGIILLLLLQSHPNPQMTPGEVRPLSRQEICATTWGKDLRHVTVKMKKQVAQAYGIRWEDRRHYEFDHLIPRSLGGADSIKNLWPQPIVEAHKKDLEENRISRMVCSNKIELDVAQEVMRRWK